MSALSVEEIVSHLTPWKEKVDAVMAQYKAFHDLTGVMPDSPLMLPVFEVMSAYTTAVSRIVGDEIEWLAWFELECDMGRQPKICKHPDGWEFKVQTLEHLAEVIKW